MVGEIFEVSLWFNSGKEAMKKQLENSDSNSGVGINIGKNSSYFDPNKEFVRLQFDDGASGKAKVKKDSWDNCTHLIQECIGTWARKNGLWRKKLSQRQVFFHMKVNKDFKEYYVYIS